MAGGTLGSKIELDPLTMLRKGSAPRPPNVVNAHYYPEKFAQAAQMSRSAGFRPAAAAPAETRWKVPTRLELPTRLRLTEPRSFGCGFTALWLSVVHGFFALCASAAPQPGLVKTEFIYETAPFPECHASTLAETKAGLVAAWFGGTRERHPDVGIWVSRLHEGKWATPVEVANGVESPAKRHPTWNPVLFQPKTGPLLLFYKVGPSPSTWWGMWMTSADAGKTWSAPRRLPDGIFGPIKNKPVQLDNGDLLCPTSTEHEGWRVHFERTSDLGKTWTPTPPVNDGKEISAIQPSILFHPGGRLQALGRTRQGKIFEIWSEDSGKTWSKMTLTALPNPSSGTDAVTLKDGRHVLVYNHSAKGRSPLNVAVSEDGKRWHAAAVLENDPAAPSGFSYPAVIQTSDGLIHCTYTWKRLRIKHAVLDPEKLESRPIVDGAWPE